jgi:hypothetical protein
MVTKLLADIDFANPAPGNNLLINGGFENWSGPTTIVNPINNTAIVDNWVYALGGPVPTATITRESTDVQSGSYSLKVVISATNGNTIAEFEQIIPNYLDYAGKTVTVSFRVKSSVANSVAINVFDGVSSQSAANVGTGWETISLTKTIQAVPTNLQIGIGMRSPATQVATYFVDSGMMVLGSVAASFIPEFPVISNLRTSDQSRATNILINGGMEFWQRGTSFSTPANATYTADRWKVNKSGTPTFTISQESTTVDLGNFSLKLDLTAGGGAAQIGLVQFVENFKDYRGKTVTLTVRMKTAQALAQAYIDDGVASSYSVAHTGNNTFQTLVVTLNVSASASNLAVGLGYVVSSPTTGTIFIDSAMLVLGSTPLAFVPKDTQVELAQCYRYYVNGNGSTTSADVGSFVAPNTYIYQRCFLPTSMRIAGAVSYTFGQPDKNGVVDTGWSDGGGAVISPTFNMVQISANKSGNNIINNSSYSKTGTFTINAEI